MKRRRAGYSEAARAIARERQRRVDEREFGPSVASSVETTTTENDGEHDPKTCDVFGCNICIDIANRGAA